jgi:predicted site-specific integrase-resolvase
MNYAEEIKKRINDTNTESVKAVIYVRVSTDTDGQKESCANQVDLAKKVYRKPPQHLSDECIC